jgi:hypothetical protein
MPRGDGMGPPKGPAGRGARMGGTKAGSGPGGYCVCPGCGEKVPHKQSMPCFKISCPKCGTMMVRE